MKDNFIISASFLHVCHEKDPNVNSCMIEAIENLRPYLRKGNFGKIG